MKVQYYVIILLGLILQIGCMHQDSLQTDKPPVSPTMEKVEPISPPMTENVPENAPQELVLQAKAQLAKKLGIDVEAIFLFNANAVEWPDASLGCPQANMVYAQVITPGYQIQLEANGQVYTFHTGETDHVILCDARGPDEIYLPP